MISVKQVSKSFHGNRVLDHISFEIPDQTATALIGPNGIGKTTLLNICADLWYRILAKSPPKLLIFKEKFLPFCRVPISCMRKIQ